MGELLPSDPWFTDFKPGQVEDFVLTTEWVEYSFAFTMTSDNVRGGPLFEMGNMEGSMDIDCNIWIDDLEFMRAQPAAAPRRADQTNPSCGRAAWTKSIRNTVDSCSALS